MPEITAARMVEPKRWSLNRPPPAGHKDVGAYVFELWRSSMEEKIRQGLPKRWHENHRLYRGKHWMDTGRDKDENRHKVTVNLIFTNIQRTVANLTARNPMAEVKRTDGVSDDVDKVFTQKCRNWWSDTEQAASLSSSALNMEIYGPAIEKYVPNIERNRLDVVNVDPYAWFPCPGYWEDTNLMPHMGHAYSMPTREVEEVFKVQGVKVDNTYSVLGGRRERNIPGVNAQQESLARIEDGNTSNIEQETGDQSRYSQNRALVIEMWLRDWSTEKVRVQTGESVWVTHDINGVELPEPMSIPQEAEAERLKYPGGIRKITVTNRGEMVLDDVPNPCVNPNLPREVQENTYGYWNFPFSIETSYKDNTSIWGFSNTDTTGAPSLYTSWTNPSVP